MKQSKNFLLLLVFAMLALACTDDLPYEIKKDVDLENIKAESVFSCVIKDDCVEKGCTYCDICGETLVHVGDTIVYKAITRNINEPCYNWQIISGNIDLLSDPEDSIIVVTFDEGFVNGQIKMHSVGECDYESSFDIQCSTTLDISILTSYDE